MLNGCDRGHFVTATTLQSSAPTWRDQCVKNKAAVPNIKLFVIPVMNI